MSVHLLRRKIAADDHRIDKIEITCQIGVNDHTMVEFDLYSNEDMNEDLENFDELPQGQFGTFTYRGSDFDLDIWRQLGRVIRISTSLRWLTFMISELSNVGHVDSEAAACLAVFFDEIKHNTSIENMILFLYSSDELPMLSLDHILLHNERLNRIDLESIESITLDQSRVIAAGLGGALLSSFCMISCEFGDNETHRQIVSACTGVKDFAVCCGNSSQCGAVASLLRDPRTMLEQLHVETANYLGDDELAAAIKIIASLPGNTKLKHLTMFFHVEDGEELINNHFMNLLCNCSSIEDIINSNHTLEKTDTDPWTASPFAYAECLELNKLTNKERVVQNKIMQYYFLGDFDSGPFVSMPISVLAKVLSLGKETRNQSTAIFNLLRSIPELCNVSSRRDEQLSNYRTTHNSSCGKRQKVEG